MTYREAVERLYALGNELPKTAKFGLENITRTLDALGNPHRVPRFIHVAGTNGKGSTCAMIEAGLREAGHRTGLYTSPHLIQPTERIQLAGAPISQQQFTEAFEEVELVGLTTYFESVTAMAFLLFAREAEIVVLETGLGGRLDATNVVTPELSVITPIDYDHQFFLGNTLLQIASEKAGICKPGIPAVIAPQHPEALPAFAHHQPLIATENWPLHNVNLTKWNSKFEAGNLSITCPLAGAHQIENARTAAVALAQLNVNPKGIANAHWSGRLERIATNPDVIVDGAHNPAGARALAAYIRQFFPGERLTLVFGAMRDKAVQEMAQILFPLFDEVILTAPHQSRAMPAQEIATLATHPNLTIANSLSDLPRFTGTTFIAGSLFLVGEALTLRAPAHTTQPPDVQS